MKIIFIGMSPLNFIQEIGRELKNKGHEIYVFSKNEEVILSQKDNPFDFHTFGFHPLPKGKVQKIILFLKGLIYFNFGLLERLGKGRLENFKDVYNFCSSYKYDKVFREMDVVNLQQVRFPSFWRELFRQDAKIIISFWGSDLLRKEKLSSIIRDRKKWIRSSNRITMQSSEMEAEFQKKFGNLPEHNDIRKFLFPLRNIIFDEIDKCKDGVSEKITVSIGYNGSRGHNHLKCLAEINKLSKEEKGKIRFTFLFRYGKDEEYTNEILERTEEMGIEYNVIDKKLLNKDLALIRKKTDILVMLPVSDAFSATVSEVLYAENLMICGSWLPYSRYKGNEVYYETIDTFEELAAKLSYVIEKFASLKDRAKGNKSKVKQTLDYEGNLEYWVQAIEQ